MAIKNCMNNKGTSNRKLMEPTSFEDYIKEENAKVDALNLNDPHSKQIDEINKILSANHPELIERFDIQTDELMHRFKCFSGIDLCKKLIDDIHECHTRHAIRHYSYHVELENSHFFEDDPRHTNSSYTNLPITESVYRKRSNGISDSCILGRHGEEQEETPKK